MEMEEELTILKIVKEDILEVLQREKSEILISEIKPEIKVSPFFISKAVKELGEEGLVGLRKDSIFLTEKGIPKAKNIVKKHHVLEDYFRKIKSKKEAFEKASILEHYVSMEVIDNIKRLFTLKKEGVPLTKLEFNKEGIITDIMFSDYGLFERIVSMGICLGEKIKVMYNIPDGIVVNVSGKNFAMGKEIAKKIEVLV